MALNDLLAAWHDKWMEPSSRLKPRPSEVRSALTIHTSGLALGAAVAELVNP